MEKLTLNVCGTELTTFMSRKDGEQLIALKPLCEALGINHEKQRTKINRNPQFSVTTLKGGTSNDGKVYNMLCIPAREVGMWVCNINANRVKPEIKPRVLEFQKHLQEVIFQALFKGVTPEQFFLLQDKLNMTLKMVQELVAENKELKARVQNVEQINYRAAGVTLNGAKKKKRITRGA